MRLGSGRLAEPTLVPSPGLGGGRSWNSSDYNDIDDFLVRMGRRARPAAGAVSRERPSGPKRKPSTRTGTAVEAPLPLATESSPADDEKVAQPLQPMPTLMAPAAQQPTPAAVAAPVAAPEEVGSLLPHGDMYRPGTRTRRRRTEKAGRAKARPKSTAGARVESEKEPAAAAELEVEASSSTGAPPTATSECFEQQASGPAAIGEVHATTDDAQLATEATVCHQTSIEDPRLARQETPANIPLLDSGDAAPLTATVRDEAEEPSHSAAVARLDAGLSDNDSPVVATVPAVEAEGEDTATGRSDAEAVAPLSDSAHIRAQIDAVMSAPFVRGAVTPLPATTVRALLPRPVVHSAGHRARRLLALAAVICAVVASVAAWLARPEVLFGEQGLLTTAALRLGRADLDAIAPPPARPPADGAPSLRVADPPVASEITTVGGALDAVAIDDVWIASDAASEPLHGTLAVARTHPEPTTAVPPTRASSAAAAASALASSSSDAALPTPSERNRAAVPTSEPADRRQSPGPRPGFGTAAAGAESPATGTSASAQRMRIAAGGASAEIVEAVPEPSGATSLDGHTFVPPKPLAASSPMPEGLAVDAGGAKGRVFLNVTVDVDGSTGVIEIVDAPPGDKALSSAVVSALRQWKFRPAELDGEQVASRLLLVFEQR